MTSNAALAKEVEAVLKARSEQQEKPTDVDLFPVYKYLLSSPSSQSQGSSSSSSSVAAAKESSEDAHWYCSKATSALHRESATYLIFLFAFQRQGTSKSWVDKLETVLLGCDECARGFGAARRRLGSRYLSNWPANVRTNFFAAVDRWQAALVLAEAAKVSRPGYGSTSSGGPALTRLSRAVIQILFGEPSLLNEEGIGNLLDEAIAGPPSPSITALGLTPTLIRLLFSPVKTRRQWALSQLGSTWRKPVSFHEWCSLGIGSEIQEIYSGSAAMDSANRWACVEAIVRERALDGETVQKGLLGGAVEEEIQAKIGRGVMSVLAGLLGSDVPFFPAVLNCFAAILHMFPTRHLWSFDPSPDLPHTLISELRKNPAYLKLLEERFTDIAADIVMGSDSPPPSIDKGKSRKIDVDGPMDWLGDLLVSLIDVDKHRKASNASATTFGEALAVATSFVFQEMQHPRLPGSLRAAAANAGFNALMRIHRALAAEDEALQAALSATLDLNSAFIATVALRPKDFPLPTWLEARNTARESLVTFFHNDGQSITRCLLSLAQLAQTERKRKKRKQNLAPAISVDTLPRASIKKELWSMAYNTLSASDAPGTGILMQSIAPFAHVELLDRQGSWTHQGLGEVVKKDEWVSAVRSINAALRGAREAFPKAIESLAMNADPVIVRTLWTIPDIPKAVILLLLSPDDEIHTPIVTLIQQSFDDVDDRADCFRALLQHFPCMAMDGLTEFLRTFIQTAALTPESCSLAKWLVRCFHDILETLCRRSGLSEALLESDDFITSFADGRNMSKRLEDLWHLMTTSLALILKRTLDWAPHFENEVMVDWMRDALIFGRQMTDHIRAFEGAVLGQSSAKFDDSVPESPIRVTSVGKKMTRQLEVILTDLILWLRLTDVETLFQTHQLIKTILGRIIKSSPDVTKNPSLEKALQEIDKFCRKASRSYTSRLTDDLLSELSDLLAPFNLDDNEEVQFVKEVSATASVKSSSAPAESSKPANKAKPVVRNAFDEMMKASGSQTPPSSNKVKPKMVSAPTRVDDADDFDDGDDFFSNLSAADFADLEKRGTISKAQKGLLVPGKSSTSNRLQTSTKTQLPSNKLHVNLTSKPVTKPPTGAAFKSKFMQEMRKEHRVIQHERKREIGGLVQKLPAASGLGTGLGAYTGSRPKVVQPVDSGSSASDSSDEENRAMTGLLAKQKSPAKPVRPVEKRSVKILGSNNDDIIRRNEVRRANAHATKMRLKPDLNPLYRYVLSWNPDHAGPLAPHGPKYAAELANMRPVATSFSSSREYEQVMLPLFLQELWAQCGKEQESTSGPIIPVEVSSRQYEDDFVEIDLSVTGPADFFVNDTEVVVLRQPGNPKTLFAKVQAFRRKPKDVSIKVRILNSMDQRELGGRAKWLLRKHLSLSTAMREFGALRGLPYYEPALLADILAGRSSIMPKLALNDIDDAIRAFDVNEPQAKAILGAMHDKVKGFTLIQGPPGTGKTKTISGLVGKWISERRMPMPVDGQPAMKPKLLICAPSNAAIDEVCKRLILGVPSSAGIRLNPTVVRIGIDASVNIAVKDVSLDSLVEARVNASSNGTDGGGEYARIRGELDTVKQQIKDKQEELRLVQNHEEKRKLVENECHALITRRTQLGQQSSKAKDAARDATRHLDGARRAARDEILKEADIICATLSGAGQDTLSAYTFETVIIDEAAQAIEMSCLIPLKYGCKRCIMVGDPNQLPPTTFSTEAERYHYNQSLFVRMTKHNSSHVQLLSIQYRMHPFISELPSKVFYNGLLKDGPDMARKTAALWHQRNVFGPYRFFNVDGTEFKTGTSTRNPDEALAAVDLYRRLNADFGPKINLAMRIGVITMYREQLSEMKRHFIQAFGKPILELIEFNTVDGFQGQEKDIIILSCVRSGPNLRNIGFLKDMRRMNVALTRAKSSLFVFGNGPTLERSDDSWKIIVGDARDRGFFINYSSTTFAAQAIEPPPSVKRVKKERPTSPLDKLNGATTSSTSQSPFKKRPSIGSAVESLSAEKEKEKATAEPLKKKRPPTEPAAEMAKRKPGVEGVKEEKEKKRQVSVSSVTSVSSSRPSSPSSKDKVKSRTNSPSAVVAVPNGRPAVPGPSRPPQPPPRTGINGSNGMPPPSRPPPPPPKGPAPPPPPLPTARAAEDALFIKKKKKPNKGPNGAGPPPGGSNIRATMNQQYGRRP